MADKLNMLFTKQMVATLALLLVCTTASAQFNVLKLAKKVTEFFDSMVMPMFTFVNKIKVYGYGTNVEQLMDEPIFKDDNVDDETWDKWFYGNLRIAPMGDRTFNSGMTVNLDARVSVSYNFGRYFIGAFGQFTNMRYSHHSSHGYLNDWFINTSFGLRL